ncbi:lipoprotein lppQ [Mycobacterium tuberculosis]|nr:lipoprotein lppQ [Mycobacterium tuberculosis]
MAAGTMPVGGRQHVFEKLASILGLVAALNRPGESGDSLI